MGTALTGTEIKDTYDSLIKVTDNGPISATAKYLSDGLGNDSALALSTGNIGINTTSPDIFGRFYTYSLGIDSSGSTALQIDGTSYSTIDMGANGVRLGFLSQSATETSLGNLSTIPLTFQTNSAERMRIDSAGNVGIGTSSPTSLVQLNGTAGTAHLRVSEAGTTIGFLGGANGIITGATGSMALRAEAGLILSSQGNTQTMVLSSAGNVGIGTNLPSYKLDVRDSTADGRALFAYQTATSGTNYGAIIAAEGIGATKNIGLYVNSQGGVTNYAAIFDKGNVGIGTDSPTAKLTVKGTVGLLNDEVAAGYATLNIVPATAIGASANRIAALNTTDIAFETSGTERMRILAGGGLTFNGDTAAANALDDYEEGTFTATLTPETSGSITGSATYNTWTYTKIGRQVTINGVFVVTSVSSPVGNFVKLGGLPFAVLAVNGAYGSFSTMFTDASAGSAKSSLPSWHSISVSEIWISIDASTIATNDEFYVTATYFV